MAERPSIILLKEEVVQYSGKKSGVFSGNSNIKQDRLLNKKIMSFKGWEKTGINKFASRITYYLSGFAYFSY